MYLKYFLNDKIDATSFTSREEKFNLGNNELKLGFFKSNFH